MIIGVDARELEGKPTGVGIYLRNILERIELPRGTQVQLYFKNEIPAGLSIQNIETILLRSAGSNLMWQQWTLSRELTKRKVALLFSPTSGCPWYFGGLQIVTVHDLSFFLYPGWFSTKERISRQLNLAFSLRQAERIYAVSPFVREELMSRFGIAPWRILVTSNGVTQKVTDPERRVALRQSYAYENVKLILYVGSIFNRRHLPVLIKAVSKLSQEHVLVIIGENRTYPYEDLAALVKKLGIESRVKLMEYVSEGVLRDYYTMADLFVYLSDYEGFGIPPLEAMSYGIPVVLSEAPAMDVIFRDAANFVKRIACEEVSRALESCLNDAQERERLIQAGKMLVARYNWEETARVVSQDWEHLLAAQS